MPARRLVLAAIVAALLAGVSRTSAQAQSPPGVIPDQYIVVLRDGVSSAAQVANEHAQQHAAVPSHVYETALKGYAARIPAQRLAALRADPRVLFISEDHEVEAVAQTLPTGVNRIEGDLSSTASGNGSGSVNVGVAVIDTGSTHADFNVAGGYNCVPDNNFVGKITRTKFQDQNGHGTHVAGTIGAVDNAGGVVGVAPGAPIYSVRVLNNRGSGSWSQVICGIDWVTASGAVLGIKVANMSLGGGGSDDNNCGNSNSDALHRAICASVNAGITYVVAAGNNNQDLGGFVPAAYNEVLAVTAIADFDGRSGGGAAATCRSDVDDTAADFSNWTTIGSKDAGHTIAAPGVCIYSTWLNGGYNTISGTSMASPHVAGTAALCLAGSCAGMAPGGVINKLRTDAANRPAGQAGYGYADDPSSPNGNRYYGHLVYAGGY